MIPRGVLPPRCQRVVYHVRRQVQTEQATGVADAGGSAFWAAGAAQQGHLLWCEASEHHRDDDRLVRRHGSVGVALVSVALPGGQLAEGVDLFRYTRGTLG